jgi:hypothetical protein
MLAIPCMTSSFPPDHLAKRARARSMSRPETSPVRWLSLIFKSRRRTLELLGPFSLNFRKLVFEVPLAKAQERSWKTFPRGRIFDVPTLNLALLNCQLIAPLTVSLAIDSVAPSVTIGASFGRLTHHSGGAAAAFASAFFAYVDVPL